MEKCFPSIKLEFSSDYIGMGNVYRPNYWVELFQIGDHLVVIARPGRNGSYPVCQCCFSSKQMEIVQAIAKTIGCKHIEYEASKWYSQSPEAKPLRKFLEVSVPEPEEPGEE